MTRLAAFGVGSCARIGLLRRSYLGYTCVHDALRYLFSLVYFAVDVILLLVAAATTYERNTRK